MELRQLEYLAAVVSHGSFGRAAQEIYVTQSALSQQIARLEDELGLKLLHRGPRGVEPTAAGLEFLDHTRAILSRVSEARAAVDDHLGAIRGSVRVAATPYDIPRLPQALAAFHRVHPQVQLALQITSEGQILEQLTTGAIDVAVCAVHPPGLRLPDQIALRTVAEDQLCLISASDGELAPAPAGGPGAVSIEVLRGRHVIMPGRGTALRARLDDAFARAGFSPLPRFETNHPAMLRKLVNAGLGVSIVPRSWLVEDGPAVASVGFTPALAPYRLVLLASTQPRIPARDRLAEHLFTVLSRRLVEAETEAA